MNDPLNPSLSLLVKLGSIVVHVDEFLSPHGHPYDKEVITGLLLDQDVLEWLQEMNKMAMLPVKRNL